jgi:L-methionine (R)-S-oxide reductase
MLNAAELVHEIQEMRDNGFLSDALLRHAVKAIRRSDARFDWVGVYLLTGEGNELWLHNYVGKATDHSRIPVGEGVCGKAVAEKANQNIADVSKVDYYLSCSPFVQSELVVLIRAGDQIFGQFDLDSDQLAAFTAEDEAAIQVIADKLAEQIASERR